MTDEVLTAHLSGGLDLGLYPLLDRDRCCWLAADFDGPSAMLDALAYLKAARAAGAPAALEVSRSGLGAHAWLFSPAPVAAATVRQLGSALLREAIALRGRMVMASYDRLFPSQDVLHVGGLGNLIAHRCSEAAGTVAPPCSSTRPRSAARGPMGLPVQRRPALPARSHPAGTTARARHRRHRRRSAPPRDVDQHRGAGSGTCARAARRHDHHRRRRPAACATGHPQTRGVDAQPGLLRTPTTTGLHLECAAVPAQLRRDPHR